MKIHEGLGVSEDAYISSEPTTVRTTEHDTVLLPCDVENLEERSAVRWWKGELIVADSSKVSETSSTNLRLFSNNSLEVSDVSSSDSGDYRCQINVNSAKPLSQQHTLLVLYPPSLKTVPESGIVEVELHKEITIGCNPSGVPKPVLTWTFKGTEIQLISSRNTLRFTATDKSMEGDYTCTANNGVGDAATATITLKLIYSPQVSAPKQWIHTAPGLRTEITCNIEANPTAKVEWFKDGRPINPNIRLSYLALGEKQMLIIKNTRESDLAEYTCKATNRLGQAQANIEISGVANQAVFKKGYKNSGDANYTLVWEVESYSPIIQHQLLFRRHDLYRLPDNWTRVIVPADAYSPGPFHTQVYTLGGLNKATLYESVVSTRNRFGWSTPSQIHRFATDGLDVPDYDTTIMSTETNNGITEAISENFNFRRTVVNYNANMLNGDDSLQICQSTFVLIVLIQIFKLIYHA